MGCHIAENRPLSLLRDRLGLTKQCHSFRTSCALGRTNTKVDCALGAPGAVIGYCQALFSYEGSARAHTEYVLQTLKEMGAPWWASHELFWGYCRNESPVEYLNDGMAPLRGFGRVPVLITGLDPANDLGILGRIFASPSAAAPGETVLVRTSIGSQESARAAGAWVRRLLEESIAQGCMPAWWPLFQSAAGPDVWLAFMEECEDAWPYVNVAVNPFVSEASLDLVSTQLTVAQVTIGLAEGISDNGTIQLAPGMRITGAPDQAMWNFHEYVAKLAALVDCPTLIVLGPSQADWEQHVNIDRVRAFLPLLCEGCNTLWQEISSSRRAMLLRLQA